ncbi:MAG TPA: stage 0 sporulation protein [Deltaproteobacteria bacterium]|nr:stage 0 sporulation protein [Deltaproteobacteria bacterium]
MARVCGIRFKKACKIYWFLAGELDLRVGDRVIVEVEKGIAMGTVAVEPCEKEEAELQHPLKRVVRKADQVDIERAQFNSEWEKEAFRICKEKIEKHGLPMKLVDVECLFDSSKAIFYFTADGRVDFRELVKDLAQTFHTRIEMRQIGVRDEAKMIGGIGPCGRELCCSSFLTEFAPVTIKIAKEQNMPLNPLKMSGLCGRLMCCLNYEFEGCNNNCHHNNTDQSPMEAE